MTSASTTALSWEERYRRIAQGRKKPEPVVHAISVEDLVVGHQLMWAGSPFTVLDVQPDGPVIEVQAVAGTRHIHVDYLRIEQVEVLDVDLLGDLLDGQHRLADSEARR